MSINWKVRIKSPSFWVGLAATIGAPVLAYYGMAASDLTTWDAIAKLWTSFWSNPYLIGTVVVAVLGVLGVTVDPTTKGLGDSAQALTYTEPKATEGAVDTAHTSEGV
jgi:phi LC3 family holin